MRNKEGVVGRLMNRGLIEAAKRVVEEAELADTNLEGYWEEFKYVQPE
jgi:hypothetical protein